MHSVQHSRGPQPILDSVCCWLPWRRWSVPAVTSRLYWQIGAATIERQKTAPWGSKVLSQLSVDLRSEFPTAKGFSPANLKYMRRFAEAWPDQDAIGQRPVGQLPWGHVIELIEKLDDAELRDWYGAKDIAQGWSRPVLTHQIKSHLHLREV